jgi:hypothetical protein
MKPDKIPFNIRNEISALRGIITSKDAQGRPYTPEYTLLLVSEALHNLELKLIDEELKPEEL